MRSMARLALLGGLMVLGASGTARAQTQTVVAEAKKTYDICGGRYSSHTGFALCASASVKVQELQVTTTSGGVSSTTTVYRVTIVMSNQSGTNGSYAGSVFTAVGLDNVFPPTIDVVNGSLTVKGPCIGDPSATCDYSQYWGLSDNKAIGGGVKIDLLQSTRRGSNYAIASKCGVDAGQTPQHGNLIVTSCPGLGSYAVLTFNVTGFFDPMRTGDLFMKAQAGPNDESTTCITSSPDCVVIPEPLTITLVASGLVMVGSARMLRRRRRPEQHVLDV